MSLELIEELRTDLGRLADEREINIKESLISLSNIKEKYNYLLKERGKIYCTKNCPDIPAKINALIKELTEYNT